MFALIETTSEYQWLASLGVGGVLAGILLVFYRQDRKSSEDRLSQERKASEDRYAQDRKASEDRYAALAMDFRRLVTENTAALTHNTEAVIGLRALISSKQH